MARLLTALSTVNDGSMLNRHDDLDASVIQNRKDFLTAHDMNPEKATRLVTDMLRRATMSGETNYCRYEVVGPDLFGSGLKSDGELIADALITTTKEHTLFLPAADCVGAVLFDPVHEVLMVSHLGRHSLEQQGAAQSVQFLVDTYGSNPADIQVQLTPAPGKESYVIWALDNKGMKEATFEQLSEAGILPENIIDDTRDTAADTDFYSYSEFLKGNRKEDGDHMIAAVML